jgi:hypothetical protein
VQAVVGTSGTDATAVLDGILTTAWVPEGDPAAEGLLVRFEDTAPVRSVQITPCAEAGVLNVTDYVNGRMNHSRARVDDVTTLELPGGVDVRTWFMRIDDASGSGCVAELMFTGDSPMAFSAPERRPGLVEASSTLEPEAPYLVDFLFDSRLDFGWVEGADGDGLGEMVTVTLEEPIQLAGIQVWNGYQRSPDHYARNARARRVRLSADGSPWTDLELRDVSGAQVASLLVPLRGKEIRLALESAWPGSQYSDLVLSELRFLGPDGPFSIQVEGEASRVRMLKRSLESKPLGTVLDTLWTSRCDGDAAVRSTFKLRSNNSFVWYEHRTVHDEETDETSERQEVFDGAWVLDGEKDDWTTIRLYGRRNRTEETWKPYASSATEEQVRVAGGRVRVARVSDLSSSAFEAWFTRWAQGPLLEQLACLAEADADADAPMAPTPELKQALEAAGAVIVDGAAMSDLLVRRPRD